MTMGFSEHLIWSMEMEQKVRSIHPEFTKSQTDAYIKKIEELLEIKEPQANVW